ncbi:Hydrolase 4 domain-containing protein [Citrus sinensis]|uniref:Hydrolase 4 domain-containing protein n=1 Tax=Citrus sinensis TaxID=2711 RepID=A0ACB8I9A8_CITSI|nr:Hydrolase 4 domain-containing protein [Citrus sinensis]
MEQLVNFIIRPPRAEYSPEHDLLDQEFMLKGKWYQRKDIEVKNKRGDVIQCSHYVPILNPDGKPLPCVIYCHGNSGCRADASEAAIILLPSNITVFTLDFSGSGLSGGEHVTLGWNEKDDLKAVVDYLRADGNVSMIGLWGRSMGAVTSLLYGAEDPSIAGMVLDSPFSDLVDLMMELVDTYKIRLPKFTVKFAIQYMRKAIQKKAKFDITDLNTIKVAKSCFVPVLFGHAVEDDFINPHHSDRIFEAYAGDKNIIKFEGDHNSPRPQFYFDSINIFFHNVLQPPEDEVGPTLIGTMHDYFGKGNLSTLHELGYFQEPSTASAEPSATSTADAIEQVRSKRPMSRTEVPSDISTKDNEPVSTDKQIGGTLSRSASNMISFELSDGHPYGPHVPTAMDDDQYVEYQLDDLAGFPSNVEEEERMFMEAVIMSLKDLEMRHPEVEQPTSVAADSFKSSGQGATNDCSTTDHCKPSESETSSSSIEQLRPMYTESTSTSLVNSRNLAPQHPSPDTSVSSVGDAFDTPPSSVESASTGTSARTDTSATASTQSSADADVSSNTKATVTVVKNPAGHVMEGLMRRWDLNFFRNR